MRGFEGPIGEESGRGGPPAGVLFAASSSALCVSSPRSARLALTFIRPEHTGSSRCEVHDPSAVIDGGGSHESNWNAMPAHAPLPGTTGHQE
jgi:hypothetical protein